MSDLCRVCGLGRESGRHFINHKFEPMTEPIPCKKCGLSQYVPHSTMVSNPHSYEPLKTLADDVLERCEKPTMEQVASVLNFQANDLLVKQQAENLALREKLEKAEIGLERLIRFNFVSYRIEAQNILDDIRK